MEIYLDRTAVPRGLREALAEFLERVAEREHLSPRPSVILSHDARMRSLNERFAKRSGPTDVLAFPDEESPEIYLSVEEAARRGDPGTEVARLALHGLLHLAGYDHKTPGEQRRMKAKEEEYLSWWSWSG